MFVFGLGAGWVVLGESGLADWPSVWEGGVVLCLWVL